MEADELGRIADGISDIRVGLFADQLREAACPSCGKAKGLEIFKSYSAYSIIVMTRWKEKPELSCRCCARKRQMKDLAFSFCFGWWGIPLGPLVTPAVIFSNIFALFSNPLEQPPSKALKQHARRLLAQGLLREQELREQGLREQELREQQQKNIEGANIERTNIEQANIECANAL